MKNKYAVSLGRKGGLARAKKLTKKQLHDIAMKGVEARKLKVNKKENE